MASWRVLVPCEPDLPPLQRVEEKASPAGLWGHSWTVAHTALVMLSPALCIFPGTAEMLALLNSVQPLWIPFVLFRQWRIQKFIPQTSPDLSDQTGACLRFPCVQEWKPKYVLHTKTGISGIPHAAPSTAALPSGVSNTYLRMYLDVAHESLENSSYFSSTCRFWGYQLLWIWPFSVCRVSKIEL